MVVFKHLKKYRGIALLTILLTFGNAIGELLLPRLMSNIVDLGIVEQDTAYMIKISGLMLLVTILTVLVRGSAAYFSSKTAMSFSRDLRRHIFSKVNHMTFDETELFGISSLITRTTNDVGQIEQLVLMSLRPLTRAPMMVIGGLLMALLTSWRLTLLALATLPVIFGVLYFILKKVVPYFPIIQKRLDRINLLFRQRLTGLRVIRAFSKDAEEEEAFQEASEDYFDLVLKVNQTLTSLRPVMSLFLNFAIIGVLYYGAHSVDANVLKIGQLMAFIQYMTQMLTGFIMLSHMLTLLPRTTASIERVQEVLAYPSRQTGGTIELQESIHQITANHLTFKYPGAQAPALEDLNFEVSAGEVLGIIGGTGSGKSTLLQLLLQFYDATSGELLLNGINIKDLETKSVRESISYVPQQNFFFTDTVRDNLKYANPDAKDAELLDYLESAQALSFLPETHTLDEDVFRGGSNFSGGQRQRLAIARALARDADIYVFDDSFSALDYKTDYQVRQALKRHLTDHITIIVAQRVATIRQADKILVLNEGEMTGFGTHQELLKTDHVYREIARSQGELELDGND